MLNQGHSDKRTAAPNSRAAVVMLIVACLVGTACDGDGGGGIIPGGGEPPDILDMTGTWTLTLNSVDLPFAFDCTEDLVGKEFEFCESFDVTVVQDGVYFLPESGSGQANRSVTRSSR